MPKVLTVPRDDALDDAPPHATAPSRSRVSQAEVLATLRLVQPASVVSGSKIRIGSDNDGGYVMFDDLDRVGTALSLGILDDDNWDVAIAARGIAVKQYDDSIEAAPSRHPKLRFFRSRIGAAGVPGTVSIEDIVDQHAPGTEPDLILKMDIEGSEWDVLETIPADVLSRFAQIVVEFHDLQRLAHRGFHTRATTALTNVARTHQAIHIHGNNHAPIRTIRNVPFPSVLEVSYVSRRLYAFETCMDVFPTSIDQPNHFARPDLFLGRSFLELDA